MLLHLDVDEKEIEEFHRRIADNVKQIRKEKKLSQTDLALSIGHKSVSMVSKIEAGLEDKHYNIEQLYKIAKVLEVDIKEFFN
ncbi:helix-turn-helix domain-containing protein [Arcobacter sp. YIC-80]|uniref:helix-turn-helix domain-containing protein n=1 Tax=Arcobacter sp. YIC-80 TaxID=3376683 RepID=UPI00384F684F